MPASITTEDRQRLLAGRDLSVDLVRVCCVLLVVVLHSLMLGLTVGPDGAIGWRNVVQAEPWFAIGSWFGQLMPLFFVVGGFASWQGWRSTVRKGGGGAEFFRARLLRLGTPAAVWFLIVGAIVWIAAGVGLPADLLAKGLGLPLWFLAAYLVCQAAVPLMIRLHTTHPIATFAVLLAAVIAVDAIRGATGVQTIGLLNLLFVWPLVQQIGFLLADGTIARLGRPALLGIAVLAFGTVGVLGSSGLYSPDMLNNLNPPTLPLVLIGVGQTALFVLVKPALDALMRTRPAQAFVGIAGPRLMTVYLWHLLLVIAVAATVLVCAEHDPGRRHHRLVARPHPGGPDRPLPRLPDLAGSRALRARPEARRDDTLRPGARRRRGPRRRPAVLGDGGRPRPRLVRLGSGRDVRRGADRPRPAGARHLMPEAPTR